MYLVRCSVVRVVQPVLLPEVRHHHQPQVGQHLRGERARAAAAAVEKCFGARPREVGLGEQGDAAAATGTLDGDMPQHQRAVPRPALEGGREVDFRGDF